MTAAFEIRQRYRFSIYILQRKIRRREHKFYERHIVPF